MSLAFIAPQRNLSAWKTKIQQKLPQLPIFTYPDIPHPEEIKYVLSWYHPQGIFASYPNLQWISSLGAGVEHILEDTTLPESVLITRIAGKKLSTDMARYVTKAILNYQQRSIYLLANQQQQKWKEPTFQEPTIGLLGFGQMGKKVTEVLQALAYDIVAYSNSPKNIAGVQHFYGNAQLPDFLQRPDILVCLLPLTASTKNILNKDLFAQCKPGTYLINVARGKHLVEEDLLEAINSGQISGACLDVFCQEPLPKDHPFWRHPQITVIPHCASLTNVDEAVEQIVKNYQRIKKGETLANIVNTTKGY